MKTRASFIISSKNKSVNLLRPAELIDSVISAVIDNDESAVKCWSLSTEILWDYHTEGKHFGDCIVITTEFENTGDGYITADYLSNSICRLANDIYSNNEVMITLVKEEICDEVII